MEKVKVLYIAGWGRSGSTILANVLGQADGFFSAGETWGMWRCAISDSRCGCGSALSSCNVWTDIFGKLGERGWADPQRIDRLSRKANMPANRVRAITGLNVRSGAMAEYLNALSDLYSVIASATGSRVIIDSTKLPGYANLLRQTPGLELYVAHLVRDPRAVAYALTKRKATENGNADGLLPRARPMRTARGWLFRNMATSLLCGRLPGRSMLVRYEDFAADPRATVRSIMDMVGEQETANPVRPDGMVEIEQSHSIAGNPSRFRTGPVPIQLDDEWQRRLAPAARSLVALITFGLLLRYRYPLHAGLPRTAERSAY